MSQQENIAATQPLGEAVNSGNLEALRYIVAIAVIDRDPVPEQSPLLEGCIHFFTGFRAALVWSYYQINVL